MVAGLTTNEPDDSQLEVAITSMLMVPGFPVGDNPVPKGVYKEGEEPLPSGED